MTSILERFKLAHPELRAGSGARDVARAEPNGYPRAAYVVTTAEQAACTCPDFCERDHGNE